jgi:hypothetical protein
MKDYKYQKWEKTRKLGIVKFTLIYGVLLWGVPVGILWTLSILIFFPSGAWLSTMVIALIVFPIGGITFGRLLWQYAENNYQNHLKQPFSK